MPNPRNERKRKLLKRLQSIIAVSWKNMAVLLRELATNQSKGRDK